MNENYHYAATYFVCLLLFIIIICETVRNFLISLFFLLRTSTQI